MTTTFQLLLALLAILVVVALVARRLDIAPSILLVAAGVVLALIPGLPRIELAPELVLLVLLPPLIYSAGVSMSWRDFRFSLRLITLLAVGCVVFTTCVVAAAAHYIIGLPWAVGFLLGAIVAPPDVVAPLALARKLGLPRRLLVVLEGEGLVNDATALILYRFAVVAISTGAFSLPQAAGTFALIVVGELAYGIGVGWLSLHARRWANDPRVEITLSLMTPYIAYWVPEHFGGSGVLAAVAAGLYVSWKGPLLIQAATRLQGIFFWDLIIYLIEGIVFLVTGLQARTLIERIADFSLRELLFATVVTTLIVVVARFVWMFPAIYVPRWIPAVRRRDPAPPWQWPFALAFTGVRGVVSLAAALAIPLTLANGQPFPHRDLILFITFGLIIITIVGLGLLLPAVMRALGLTAHGAVERQREAEAELTARQELLELAGRRIDDLAAACGLSPERVRQVHARHDQRLTELVACTSPASDPSREIELHLALITAEREILHELLREGRVSDETRRRLERELDLEEARLSMRTDSRPDLPM
jgi:monovalent cation/hydrogen antiporter